LPDVPFLQFFFVQIGLALQLSLVLHDTLLHFDFLSGTLHLFSSHVLCFEHVFNPDWEHLPDVPFLQFFFVQIGLALQLSLVLHDTLLHIFEIDFDGTLHTLSSQVSSVLHSLSEGAHFVSVPALQFFFVQIGLAWQLSLVLHATLLHFDFDFGTLTSFFSLSFFSLRGSGQGFNNCLSYNF